MRNTFAEEVTHLSKEDPRLVMLSGDIGNRLFDKFKEANGDRFFNCGVAEADMVGVAAGMALSGLRPFIYTITPFTTTRCYEQIRVDICYHNVPVIIVGTGSGLSYAELGPTHHSLEDLAIMRVLPNMTVLAPCDSIELSQLLKCAIDSDGPVYIRIGKKGEPAIHPDPAPQMNIGKAVRVAEGKDVCFVACGTIMGEVVEAAKILKGEGITSRIESFHTIKPLDTDTLAEVFSEYAQVVVCEEHSLIGGLTGAVAQWRVQQRGSLAEMTSVGVADEFMHEVGSQKYARRKYGMDAQSIANRVLKALSA
ncbi:MAG: transketolase [Nitrospinota bacterium]|nr:transketolase [Nitrospinota bacterium]